MYLYFTYALSRCQCRLLVLMPHVSESVSRWILFATHYLNTMLCTHNLPMTVPKFLPWLFPHFDVQPMAPRHSESLVGSWWNLLALCWIHREYSTKYDNVDLFLCYFDTSPRCLKPNQAVLTLSLTVSFIFELALLTAEYKNDPKFFAPCVTFVVTISGNERKKNIHRIKNKNSKWKISCTWVHRVFIMTFANNVRSNQSINRYVIDVNKGISINFI